MHVHRLGQGPANGPRSTKPEVLGAHNRPIVIPFDNDTVRDMALSHIQQARFHFRDERNVKLDVTRLSEGTATKTSFVLDSRLVEFLRLPTLTTWNTALSMWRYPFSVTDLVARESRTSGQPMLQLPSSQSVPAPVLWPKQTIVTEWLFPRQSLMNAVNLVVESLFDSGKVARRKQNVEEEKVSTPNNGFLTSLDFLEGHLG
ncbi:hypothetical protein HO133_008876 [Letharia lupina]|uniref:Uncharacterized protein n=1 Tax=Letharia lupina TaxID=560253 RepID=A0A8H6CPW3_9LECA|nr:uncharacterized protein HO133_008876 [Letharia lupina]KAF6227432.1 hypothetical protein HO133_008876 [Letharia lupina]